jgi:hypothetical protein
MWTEFKVAAASSLQVVTASLVRVQSSAAKCEMCPHACVVSGAYMGKLW